MSAMREAMTLPLFPTRFVSLHLISFFSSLVKTQENLNKHIPIMAHNYRPIHPLLIQYVHHRFRGDRHSILGGVGRLACLAMSEDVRDDTAIA